MVATEAHDAAGHLMTERQNAIDTLLGVGASVDVVTQEHHHIAPCHLALQLAKQVVQSRAVAVNVSNSDRSHAGGRNVNPDV